MTRPRLAVVLSHPVQYYSPWFRSLAGDSRLTLKVFYLWDSGVKETRDPHFETNFKWDVDLLSGYESDFVPNRAKHPGAESFFGFNNPELAERLSEWKPSAILLFGYKWRTHMGLIIWSAWKRIPIIFRGDSHFIGRPKVSLLQRAILGPIFGRMAAVAYVGEANRRYFRALGVPADRLYFAPHSVNADHFDPSNSETRRAAASLRERLGAKASTRIVLFSGKFVPDKQPMELLEAFLSLNEADALLVLGGDGPLREALTARAAASPNVRILPFANQIEMPSRYLASDLFVLASRGQFETWGLAVNEAMHMGIPCLVSSLVGCQLDLVEDRRTGWVCDAGQPASLRAKLKEALETLRDPAKTAGIKAEIEARISQYTYTQTTEGLVAALNRIAA